MVAEVAFSEFKKELVLRWIENDSTARRMRTTVAAIPKIIRIRSRNHSMPITDTSVSKTLDTYSLYCSIFFARVKSGTGQSLSRALWMGFR